MASHRTPSTGTLERFCEYFSCVQLEYCLREPLSKFEGLSTFYCNFINVNICIACIWDIRPIPTIRTIVRIIDSTYNTKVNWSHYVYLQRLAMYVQWLITDMLVISVCLVLLTCVPIEVL